MKKNIEIFTKLREGNRLILKLQYGSSLHPLKRGYKLISQKNYFINKYKECFQMVLQP